MVPEIVKDGVAFRALLSFATKLELAPFLVKLFKAAFSLPALSNTEVILELSPPGIP